MGKSPGDLLRPFLLIGGVSAAGLVLLYVAHLFYLQFLLVVWGGAVMAAITVYERRTGDYERSPMSLGDADRLIALQETLAAIDDRLSRPRGPEEEQYLRARKAAVEQDMRKLRWSIRESGLQSLRRAAGQERLKPLPPGRPTLQDRKHEKREEGHLLDSLGEAEEVLAAEPGTSARARLELIAADIKAHYNLLKGLGSGSRYLGDYATAWVALASIARGVRLGREVNAHASRKVKARLDGLCDLAIARGLVARSMEKTGVSVEEAERWK